MPANAKKNEKKRAIKWLLKGKTAKWTADKVGVDPTTVQRWAKDAGIKLTYPYNRHVNRTDLIDKDEIIRLRAEAVSTGRNSTYAEKPMFTLGEIADLMDCSYSYVKLVCKEATEAGKLKWTRVSVKR